MILQGFGELERNPKSRLHLQSGPAGVRRAILLFPVARQATPDLELEVAVDDLVEIELEDGTCFWTSGQRLLDDTQDGSTASGSQGRLPTRYYGAAPAAKAGRGEEGLAIKCLRILDVSLPPAAGPKAVARIEAQLEGQQPGFYRIDRHGELKPEAIPAIGAPVLVLLHGTASSTQGTFGDLFLPENLPGWQQLHSHYGGRVYGFEHRTLSESPVQNVVEFLERLPAGQQLHLLSHGRGGLIGELLALGELGNPIPTQLLDRLRIEAGSRENFARANALLIDKHPEIERFVRVACPAGGSSIAAGRLDIRLSLLFGLFSRKPTFGPFLGGLGELVAAVAKDRVQPADLPGLAAQMPDSGVIRLINGAGYRLGSELTVIAGDADGSSRGLASLHFRQANDLVVATRSMFRGVPRRQQLWYRAQGGEVHHGNYFSRPETRNKVMDGLLRGHGDASGFAVSEPRGGARSLPAGDPRDLPDRPAVVLLPDLFGSHLAVHRPNQSADRIWLEILPLLSGSFAEFPVATAPPLDPSASVRAEALLERFYGRLAKYLRQHEHHVIPFPYDWRRSVREAAVGLATLLSSRLEAGRRPIHLVAHGLGGLVARYLIAAHADVWDALRRRGGRLLELGVPHRGSFHLPRLLQGRDPLLGLVPGLVRQEGAALAKVLAGFPGLLETAPQAEDMAFFRFETWRNLSEQVLALPRQEDLDLARKVVATLASVDLRQEPALYVAGHAAETPTRVPGDTRIRMTPRGDGRVTWESGIPPGVPTYYIEAEHGALANHEPSFPGLLELLMGGATRLLPSRPPAAFGAPSPSASEVAEAIEVFPSQEALEMAAMGVSDEDPGESPGMAPRSVRTRVQVVHGDLTFAQNPVMVGHYAGDPLVSAEATLDLRLQGKLSTRHLLDLYPRAIGSNEIVLVSSLDPQKRPEGAIVIGLGPAGSLTAAGLSRSVTEALVRYGRTAAEHDAFGSGASGLGVTSLLIGGGEMGLALEQVVQSILLGVRLANQRLSRLAGTGERAPAITRLELMEIFEDRALQAIRALRGLVRSTFDDFQAELELRHAAGGRRRTSYGESGGWWVPLVIRSSSAAPGAFDFTAFGQQARALPESLEIQGRLVEHLLGGAQSAAAAHQQQLCQTLYELLLPLRLKKSGTERQNLLLVVDEASAQFPWEILIDRNSVAERPVGVDAGLIRQLRFEAGDGRARVDAAHPEGLRALVVGDPPSDLRPLPGARREALQVASLFERRQWKVERQIRDDAASSRRPGRTEIDAESIIAAALTRDYRIVHLAGHGIYDPDRPKETGLIVGGQPGGRLVLLSPAEIRQMRLVPELVFINSCHLGRIETTRPHLLAANLAIQFIANGVKAVVAAGWSVNDDAALVFADVFYEQMFQGATFGAAVAEARRATYRGFPSSMTWAAYQCYGDPGFRLTLDLELRQEKHRPAGGDFVDPVELAAELENLLGRAKVEKGAAHLARIRAELQTLAELVTRRAWLFRGGVAAGFGRVYGEIKDREAIRFYEAARASEGGLASMRDLEQLANLRARFAEEDHDQGTLAPAIAFREIGKSIEELKILLSLAFTRERSALLASAYKRRDLLRPGPPGPTGDTRADLEEMAWAYARAALAQEDDLYAGINALASVLVLGGPFEPGSTGNLSSELTAKDPFLLREQFERALESYTVLARLAGWGELGRQQDFWSESHAIDIEVIAALYQYRRDPTAASSRLAQVGRDLRQLFSRYGSPREQDSMLKQLRFLDRHISCPALRELCDAFVPPSRRAIPVSPAAPEAGSREAPEETAAPQPPGPEPA